MSVLLSAITFTPAMAPRVGAVPTEGYISADAIAADKTCKPGAICASYTGHRNACFFNNFWDSSKGGTPLAIDVTQTGPNGSNVYVYWVNNTNATIAIKGKAYAKSYCF